MAPNVRIRALTDSDGPAFAGLSFSSEDEGRVRYAANYAIDAMQAIRAIHGAVIGVGAVTPDGSRMVGVGLARLGRCLVEGTERPYALLGNLIVHPDFRRQGLARQLAAWRIEQARAQVGEDLVILANYQRGNIASERAVQSWAGQVLGPYHYLALKTRRTPPAAPPGLVLRPALPDELEAFTGGLNSFYAGANFFQPRSADQLDALLRAGPLASPFRHAWVAVNRQNEIQAGMVAMEEFRLKQMEIRALPRVAKLLNSLARILPPDGAIRQVYLDNAWHQPGQAQAARALVEQVRWAWREQASNLSVYFDPRGPLRRVFRGHPFSVRLGSNIAVLSDPPVDSGRPVCPIY